VVIQCYTSDESLTGHLDDLRAFFQRLGVEGRQGAVGFVIDRDYLEISFPLDLNQDQAKVEGQSNDTEH
jgi:hypothetical protein